MNREQWLTDLSTEVTPLFKGFALKPFRLTVGWPISRGRPGKRQVLGECHALESSTAGLNEIFITPLIADPIQVAGVVCHELAHVAAGVEAAHGRGFVKVCRHVGLTRGKPTSVMPGERLEESLKRIVGRLGKYPHEVMQLKTVEAKRQPTGVTLVCDCGFRCSTSRKWVSEVGVPTCACGAKLEEQVKGE